MVSVIIPVYNVEAYLARCLDSVLAQTCPDIEIVCVDDCGTDGSMAVARRYAAAHPDRIRIVESEENAGLGGARDKGIAAAAGEYLLFVDSDDAVTPGFAEAYLRAAEESGADIVAGGHTRVEGEKEISRPGRPEDPWYVWVNINAWAKLFRTSFLRENGIDFRGIRTYEDAPFLFRCLACGASVRTIRDDGYRYYQNPGSITTGRRRDRTALYEAYEADLRALKKEAAFPEERQEIWTYTLASQLITNLLFNGQHAGVRRMKELYRSCDEVLRELDPDLKGNRFVSRKIPVSEPSLNRTAAWLTLKLRRIGLDRALFLLVSLLPKIR